MCSMAHSPQRLNTTIQASCWSLSSSWVSSCWSLSSSSSDILLEGEPWVQPWFSRCCSCSNTSACHYHHRASQWGWADGEQHQVSCSFRQRSVLFFAPPSFWKQSFGFQHQSKHDGSGLTVYLTEPGSSAAASEISNKTPDLWSNRLYSVCKQTWIGNIFTNSEV